MTVIQSWCRWFALLATIVVVIPPASVAGQSARVGGPPLPVSAAPVEEMHGDWRVICALQDGKRVCAFSQQQTNKDTGQLLLAIELRALLPDFAEGTLILPFGLALQSPISLEINDSPIGTPILVRTCLPVGCLAGVSLDAAMIASLRKAQSLIVRATVDGGQGAVFTISLNGFSNALDRAAALAP